MAQIIGCHRDGTTIVADDGRFYLLTEEGRCTCGASHCPHTRLEPPAVCTRYYRPAADPEYCPGCGAEVVIYRAANGSGSVTLCPRCGQGIRRRTVGYKSSLHHTRGRRARTATRYT